MVFERFSSKGNINNAEAERLLPYDVRYALRYREAKLGAAEILDLANNNFAREAMYILLKGMVLETENQREVLQSAVDVILGNDDIEKGLRELVQQRVALLRPDVVVDGKKLAQLSRQGFRTWHELYEDMARESAENATETFLVGHATLVGLDSFVRSHFLQSKKLHILIPYLFEKSESAICGFSIENGIVSGLDKNFERIEGAIVIDDVKRTGDSLDEVIRFWTKEDEFVEPDTRVLVDVSDDSQTQ